MNGFFHFHCFNIPAFGLDLQPHPGVSGGDRQHFRFDLPPGVSPEILLHRIPIPRPTIPPRGVPSEYKSNKAWFKRHMRDPHKHHIIFLVRCEDYR